MEYEYSFAVSAIDEYIKFCNDNNFNFIDVIKQTRIIYRNKNKTIARLTIEDNQKTVKKLDFKEDKLTKKDLNVRKESKSLLFDDDNAVESILEFLRYRKDNTIVRTRMIYEKVNIRFEIDKYEQPNQNFVVAIEGEKKEVDQVYKELLEINKKYKI